MTWGKDTRRALPSLSLLSYKARRNGAYFGWLRQGGAQTAHAHLLLLLAAALPKLKPKGEQGLSMVAVQGVDIVPNEGQTLLHDSFSSLSGGLLV